MPIASPGGGGRRSKLGALLLPCFSTASKRSSSGGCDCGLVVPCGGSELPPQPGQLDLDMQQLPQQPRTYVNLPMLEAAAIGRSQPASGSHHDYMNLPAAAATDQQPAELSDPQLNYMDMDFSTGVGLPAASASGLSSAERRLNYAQLRPCESGAVNSQCQAVKSSSEMPVAYCELDLRAMAALAATVKEEERLLQSGSVPRHQHQEQHQELVQLRHHQQPGAGRRPADKPLSLTRIRSSLSRSLSRLSLRRQRSRSQADQS